MRRWIILAMLLIPPHPSQASVKLAGNVEEQFASDTNVAGYILVGLRVGGANSAVMLTDMRLALPKRSKQEMACIDGTTEDGRYAVHGTFLVLPGPPGEGLLEPKRWSYTSELRQYSGGEFALRAEIKTDCDEATDGILIPSILTETNLTTLVALINGQRAIQVSASLADQGQTFKEDGACRATIGERRTAFDTICSFSLVGLRHPSLLHLSVERLTRAGDIDSDQFSVELDPNAW